MLVPLKWLRDYVDIDIDTQEFADMMTMTGSKSRFLWKRNKRS